MLEVIANLGTIKGVGASAVGVAALKVSGIRVGPGRACALALKSRFFGVPALKRQPQSQRATEVADLCKRLANLKQYCYIVV